MIKTIMKAFGYVRKEELNAVTGELFAARCREEELRYGKTYLPSLNSGSLMKQNRELLRERDDLRRQLVEKEAQYADAVSRWAGLARLWQEEHGGGLMYVTSEERKVEENENVALEAAAVSAGCAAEGTETGADCDPSELAGQGDAGASAGEQGDGIPKG